MRTLFPEHVRTERLDLRRWRPDEGDDYARIWADPHVWRALRGSPTVDFAFVRRRFEHHLRHWERKGFGLLAVRERAAGEAVGWAGPAHPTFVPELSAEVEIGWSLRRAYWGRGYAHEAARAAIREAFAALDVERVISMVEPANARSSAVARRLGMRSTGRAYRTEGGAEVVVYELVAGPSGESVTG